MSPVTEHSPEGRDEEFSLTSSHHESVDTTDSRREVIEPTLVSRVLQQEIGNRKQEVGSKKAFFHQSLAKRFLVVVQKRMDSLTLNA